MNFDLKSARVYQPPKPAEKSQEEEFEREQEYEEQYKETVEEYDPASDPKVGKILYSWKAPEYEVYEKSLQWYLIGAVFILLMVAYALFTNGPIMAITFILIGIVGYIHLQKDPRVITFAITSKGLFADKQLYSYENIYSFWIFYDVPHTKVISLHTKASVLPFVHIPISSEDPVKLRELLLQNIPEIKQDPSLVDTLERVLHI